MNVLLLLVIVVIVVAVLIALKVMSVSPGDTVVYESKGVLFSPAERSFLGVLEQALDSRYRVLGKVRLGDIVKPVRGLDKRQRTVAQNKINRKHVDFVICTANELALVGVVELDDQSHERADRAGRDEFIDKALAASGIPLLRFPAKKGYTVQEVRVKIEEMMRATSRSHAVTAPQVGVATVVRALSAQMKSTVASAEAAATVCPKCSAEMVKRQAVKGDSAGKFFWACTMYPTCRQVMEIGEV